MSHPRGVVDLGMKNQPIATVRERFAMRGNNRRASLFVQPGMRGSHAGFYLETINRYCAGLSRRHSQIDQKSSTAFSAERLQQSQQTAPARNEHVTGLFPQ